MTWCLPKVLLAATCLASVNWACSSSGLGLSEPTASGSWVAVTAASTILLSLSEGADGALSGAGQAVQNGTAVSIEVNSGRHDHPAITFALLFGGAQTVVFSGQFLNPDEFTVRDGNTNSPQLHFRRR